MLRVAVFWNRTNHRRGRTWLHFDDGGDGLLRAPVALARARAFFQLNTVRAQVPSGWRWEFGEETGVPFPWTAYVELLSDTTGEVLDSLELNAGTPLTAIGGGAWRDGIGIRVRLETGQVRNKRLVRGAILVVPYLAVSSSGRPNSALAATMRTQVQGWVTASASAGVPPVVFRQPTSVGGGEVLPVTGVTIPVARFAQMTRRRRKFPGPPPQ